MSFMRLDVTNAASMLAVHAARISWASRPSARGLTGHYIVPYGSAMSGLAAGGRVEAVVWTDEEGARLYVLQYTAGVKGLN